MRGRLVQLLAASVAVPVVLAACGGGDGSGADPASVAPPSSPLYLEASFSPDADSAEAIDELAATLAGIDDLGAAITAALEDGEEDEPGVDFAADVEPWLGERGGLFFASYDGEDFEQGGFAIAVTDSGAAQEFIDRESERSDEPVEEISYEGVDFSVEDDGESVGIVGDLFVFAESQADFEAAVDASEGDSLAGSEVYGEAIGTAAEDAVADLYVDIGGLIESSGGAIDPEAQAFLDTVGIAPGEATLVASMIPRGDQIEVEVSTDATGENPTSGDSSELLGSVPANAVAAFSSPEFGARFGEMIDQIDEEGIPGAIPPDELKSGLGGAGVDLNALAESVGDMALFVEEGGRAGVRAAIVLETSGEEAQQLVSDVGGLLRSADVDGVTEIGSGLAGFSVRDPDLGPEPLIVATKGDRVAISYGLAAATRALSERGQTLAESSGYEAAAEALGETPISAYVDGAPALAVLTALVGPDEDLEAARPYLEKIEYVAAGTGAEGDRSTAKLIVGVGK